MFEGSGAERIVTEGVRLADYTSFKIGGPARFFALPSSVEELALVIRECRKNSLDFFVIGNGTNLLVSDEGYDGCVICTRALKTDTSLTEREDGLEAVLSAGESLSKKAKEISKMGYEGFEFATGIPGSVGGAVVMNAGAYGGEIKDCIKSVEVLFEDGRIGTLKAEELSLGYRHSVFQDEDHERDIVLTARFDLKKGNPGTILFKVDQQLRARRDRQPIEYPSAGSVFKRPEGNYAGKLIQEAGLMGMKVGGAAVSEKHANFIINEGTATAADVAELIDKVRERVYENSGVMLEPEVRRLGKF
ncbi:MAG: UDP-N-acetylmuramate dehydrogenase [Lachnospiraceae bacterium]|nr:UDP-N-acetylmuramate dehydrogenase [Lachnospiraceae bacterium]